MVQCVKDLALSLQGLGLLLWCGFDPWPGNVHVLQVQPKKKKKKKQKKKKGLQFSFSPVPGGSTFALPRTILLYTPYHIVLINHTLFHSSEYLRLDDK